MGRSARRVRASRALLSNNSASHGGGIYLDDSGSTCDRVVVYDSTLIGNTAVGYGGAAFVHLVVRDVLWMVNSRIENNSASYGGAVYGQSASNNAISTAFGGNHTGHADDPEDGPLGSNRLEWRDNSGAPLGNGPSITLSNLPVGFQRIWLHAYDSNGQMARVPTEVEIIP
jgi:predicted outer membrane repeat protein